MNALTLLALLLAGPPEKAEAARSYDPLRLPAAVARSGSVRLDVSDAARSRTIPLRVELPATKDPAPVVLFSHGLGGSREAYVYLGRHWAARGFAVVFLQHPGSDTSVWRDLPLAQRQAALEEAASARNLVLRVRDVSAVLDQLERWDRLEGHPLHGRLDLARVGMAGHSFGALTTQAVSGQTFPVRSVVSTEPRIKAAIALSPSSPRLGDLRRAFGAVKVPWMLMTGTRDVSRIGGATVASRLAVFPALPPGSKYEVVLDGAEHSAFTERALPGDAPRRDPNHHRAVLALSTAFWDAFLCNDPAARRWLDGDGPRTVLEPADRWTRK